MTDPIEALQAAMAANPTQRLCQLVYNAVRTVAHEDTEVRVPPCPPFFYASDELLVEGLRRMATRGQAS